MATETNPAAPTASTLARGACLLNTGDNMCSGSVSIIRTCGPKYLTVSGQGVCAGDKNEFYAGGRRVGRDTAEWSIARGRECIITEEQATEFTAAREALFVAMSTDGRMTPVTDGRHILSGANITIWRRAVVTLARTYMTPEARANVEAVEAAEEQERIDACARVFGGPRRAA